MTETKTKQKKHIVEKTNVREHPTWQAGDVALQGDLIFVALEFMPDTLFPSFDGSQNRQLAPGTTKGARHICKGGDVFEAANWASVAEAVSKATNGKIEIDDERYVGPLIRGPFEVDHPQHATHVFPTDCPTAVIYQRNLDSEEREMRARD